MATLLTYFADRVVTLKSKNKDLERQNEALRESNISLKKKIFKNEVRRRQENERLLNIRNIVKRGNGNSLIAAKLDFTPRKTSELAVRKGELLCVEKSGGDRNSDLWLVRNCLNEYGFVPRSHLLHSFF